MSLVLQRLFTTVSAKVHMKQLVEGLRAAGYIPLFDEANERYKSAFSDFGMGTDIFTSGEVDEALAYSQELLRLTLYQRRMYSGEYEDMGVVGDFVFTKQAEGGVAAILYFLLLSKDYRTIGRSKPKDPKMALEVGFVGDEAILPVLTDFTSVVEGIFGLPSGAQTFEVKSGVSQQFAELIENKDASFVAASSVSAEDESLAGVLENLQVRQLAVKVRRGGSLLANDLSR